MLDRVELELRDALKVTSVASHQSKVVVKGSGRYEEVGIAEDLTSASEIAAETSKPTHDAPIEREDAHQSEEPLKALLVRFGITTMVDTVVDLAVGNQADRQAMLAELLQQGHGPSTTLEPFHNPICIDQIAHSSIGGRVESLRLA